METWRKAAMAALAIRDEAELLAGMSRGQLEAHVADAGRAMATAPPEPSGELRAAAQARATAQAQGADAEVRGDTAAADRAGAKAAFAAADQARLEQQMAVYERWSTGTAPVRDMGGKARAELERRGWDGQPEPEQGSLLAWWRQFEADLEKVDQALAREQQAALAAGLPWPPARRVEAQAGDDTQAGHGHAPAAEADPPGAEAGGAPRAAGSASPRGAQPPPPAPEPEGATEVGADAAGSNERGLFVDPGTPETEPEEPEADEHAARLEALNAQLDDLTVRAAEVAAERAAHRAADDWHVRRQAEAQAEAEAEPAAAAGDFEPEA